MERGNTVLTETEQGVLRTFRQYLITPGQMLCFAGPNFKKYRTALRNLTDKDLLIEERFKGGYSLTDAGFAAMKEYT
jgi:predicted transcriptional regulator